MAKRINPKLNVAIAFALAIGLSLSVTLIVLGSRDSSNSGGNNSGSRDDGSQSTDSRAPTATLPPNDGTAAEIGESSGLAFPADMTGFRSAANPNGQQTDIIFLAPPASAAQFVTDSKLPTPVAGERLILHGSPLWGLNPEGDVTISSTESTHGKVHRTVELVTDNADPAAAVQLRVTLTPAG